MMENGVIDKGEERLWAQIEERLAWAMDESTSIATECKDIQIARRNEKVLHSLSEMKVSLDRLKREHSVAV